MVTRMAMTKGLHKAKGLYKAKGPYHDRVTRLLAFWEEGCKQVRKGGCSR